MARYDRYEDDVRSRGRGYGRDDYEERERGGGMFDFGGGSGRDDDPARGGYGRAEQHSQRERHYGSDDHNDGLPMDETGRLIASNKVEGTTVYGRDGSRLGTIFNFMVDKYDGHVEYAVMRYGGFLGMGERYYPLPWRVLSYDTRRGGYRIELTDRDLQSAPSFGRHDEPRFNRSYGEEVDRWYGGGRR